MVVPIVTGMVRASAAAPELLIVTVKVMMPFAIPAMGFSMGVVVWFGLAAQGIKGQDKAHRQDNGQPSAQVHSLTLLKKLSNRIF